MKTSSVKLMKMIPRLNMIKLNDEEITPNQGVFKYSEDNSYKNLIRRVETRGDEEATAILVTVSIGSDASPRLEFYSEQG